MWFVWDGQRRHGPFNDNEICRRVIAGELSFHVWIRSEDEQMYQPLVWFLRRLTAENRTRLSGQTPDFANVHLDVTQVAASALSATMKQGVASKQADELLVAQRNMNTEQELITPDTGDQSGSEFPLGAIEKSSEREFEFSLKDSLKSIFSKKISELNLFSKSGSQRDERSKIKEVLSESEALSGQNEQGFEIDRLDASPTPAPVFRPEVSLASEQAQPQGARKSRGPAALIENSEPIEPLQVVGQKNQLNKNQLPKHISEGVINLAGQEPQRRARIRRVNPTAPRRPKRQQSFWDQLLRSTVETLSNPTVLLVLVTSFVMTLALMYFGPSLRKQRISESVTPPEIQSEALISASIQKTDPTIQAIRDAVENKKTKERPRKRKKRVSSKGSRQKELRAKSKAAVDQSSKRAKRVTKDLKDNVFSGKGALTAHLSSSRQGDLIIVGPVRLVRAPPTPCAPCEGQVRLPDGTILVMRSVFRQPWSELRFQNSFYARGSLVKAKPYFLFLNKVSASAKFK